ncbi:VanZ family protein [Haliangium sp.]|uniref:VanZ family protein n=1 Tax=Haliangium sp. TaxID=2663208 RepID=UPI003D0A6CB4
MHSPDQDRPSGDAEDARGAAREAAAGRWFGVLAMLYVGFIAAATLSVGTGEVSLSKGLRKLAQFHLALTSQVETMHDLRDIATNILLFMPLGALMAARLGRTRLRWKSWWLTLGVFVSLAVEIAQAFTDRSPDPVDLVTNGGGYVLGFLLVWGAVRRFDFDPALILGLSRAEADATVRTLRGALFIYVCGYMVLLLVPFDLTVSLTRIHAKLLATGQEPRILLDPLYHLRAGDDGVLDLLYATIGIMPAAALKAHIDARRGRASLAAVLWLCTVLATSLELAQVFIVSRTVDIANVVLAPLGALLGWALARGWERLRGMPLVKDESTTRIRVYALVLVALGYVVILAVLAWAPYRFETDLDVVVRKLREDSNWVPFRLHFEQHSLPAIRDLLEETAQFVPLGLIIHLLAVQLGLARRKVLILLLAAGTSAVVDAGLELSQGFCIGRVVDITDVIVAAVGGLVGAALLALLVERRRDHSAPPSGPD